MSSAVSEREGQTVSEFWADYDMDLVVVKKKFGQDTLVYEPSQNDHIYKIDGNGNCKKLALDMTAAYYTQCVPAGTGGTSEFSYRENGWSVKRTVDGTTCASVTVTVKEGFFRGVLTRFTAQPDPNLQFYQNHYKEQIMNCA